MIGTLNLSAILTRLQQIYMRLRNVPNPVKPDPHSGLKPDPESSRSRTLNPVIPDPPFSERCDAGIFLLLDHPLLSQH
jgi:hypothetical protein